MKTRVLSLAFGALLVGCVTEPTPVTVTFCAGQVVGNRIFVRDETRGLGLRHDWEIVDSPDGMNFSFSPAHRLSLALTESETATAASLRVFQLTSDELPKLNCLGSNIGPLRDYTGSFAGLGTGRTGEAWLGTGRVARGNGAFTLRNAATGTADLVSWMRVAGTVERFIVRRDIDLDGAALAPIDFAATEGGAPRTSTVTITGTGTAGATIRPSYQLVTRGTIATLPSSASSGTMTIASLPIDLQLPSDFYVIGASIFGSGTGFGEGRSVSVRFSAPVDRTLALGSQLAAATTEFVGAEAPTMVRLSFPVQSEYSARADATITQFLNSYSTAVTMTITRAFRGSAPTWDFETPDPAQLGVNGAKLDPTGPAVWSSYASSADYSSLFLGSLSSELTVREAFTSGTVGSAPAGGTGMLRIRTIPELDRLRKIRLGVP